MRRWSPIGSSRGRRRAKGTSQLVLDEMDFRKLPFHTKLGLEKWILG